MRTMAIARKAGIGVWFQEEVENIIASVESANVDVARHIQTKEMKLYRNGYSAALEAVATAFGVRYQRQG